MGELAWECVHHWPHTTLLWHSLMLHGWQYGHLVSTDIQMKTNRLVCNWNDKSAVEVLMLLNMSSKMSLFSPKFEITFLVFAPSLGMPDLRSTTPITLCIFRGAMSNVCILGYWDIRGLAEPIRLLLEHVEANYEDRRWKHCLWWRQF